MFNLGGGEILIVLVLTLIFLGPEKLPDIATKLGRLVNQVRRAVDDVKDEFKDDFKK